MKPMIKPKKKDIKHVVCAGWGKGSVTNTEVEGNSGYYPRYVGIAPFRVMDVCPDINGIKAIYPNMKEPKEQKYTFDSNGNKGAFAVFYLESEYNEKLNPLSIRAIARATFALNDKFQDKKDGSKYQIVNDFGHFTYVTPEELKNKVSADADKQAFSWQGVRRAYVGEEDLIRFIKKFKGIQEYRNYKDGVWSVKEGNLDEFLASFSDKEIKDIINGNMKSLKASITECVKTNKIKLFCGIRTTSDGKEYQEVCTKIPIPFAMKKYDTYIKSLETMKDNGSFSNINFGEPPYEFKEIVPEKTNFTPPVSDDDPTSDLPF